MPTTKIDCSAWAFTPGPIDGSIGAKSKRAIKAFQRCHAGLRATGTLDMYTKAYLDEEAPAGSDDAHYQFIVNYIGYHCGAIDGPVEKKTKRAIANYREAHGLAAGEDLDDEVKTALDAEALAPLERRAILERDLDFPEPHANLPAAGTEKKISIDRDGSISPLDLPYGKKFASDTQNLLRPHFPHRGAPVGAHELGRPFVGKEWCCRSTTRTPLPRRWPTVPGMAKRSPTRWDARCGSTMPPPRLARIRRPPISPSTTRQGGRRAR
jgi:peptidoglycan hydrolase-like protein with peptidoglycan-binding domain